MTLYVDLCHCYRKLRWENNLWTNLIFVIDDFISDGEEVVSECEFCAGCPRIQ